MSPEQAQNPALVDGRADIYAIGILLFEALCGQRPFVGHTVGEIIGAQLFQRAERPSVVALRKQLPPRHLDWRKLDAIVEKTLAKAPSARFQDCVSLCQELEAAWGQRGQWAEAGQTYGSQNSLGPVYAKALPKPRAWLIGGAVLTLGVLAAGGVGHLLQGRRTQVVPVAASAPPARAAARLQAAQSGGVAERRALIAAVELVRSRALLPYVEAALRDPAAAVWPAAVPVAAVVGTAEDAALRELLTQRASQPVGAVAVELAAARLRLGERAAIPTLTAAAGADAAGPRLRATLALALAGVVSAAVLQRVLARSGGPGEVAPALRQAALLQLVRMGDAATEKQLQQALQGGIKAALRDNVDAVDEALAVYARAGRPAAQTQLVQLAEQAPVARRLALGVALADAGDARAVALLVPLFRDATPRIRQRAAGGLGSLGTTGAVGQPALAALLDDPDPGVALTAAAALVSVSAPPRTARAESPFLGATSRGLPTHG